VPEIPPSTRWSRLKDFIIHHHAEPGRLACAVALGVFIGMTPFYGFQTLLAAGLAGLFRLNIAGAVLATQISNPMFAPFIITSSVWLGEKMGGRALPAGASWWDIREPRFYQSWLRGGLVLGLTTGALCGVITWAVASRVRRRHHA